jgi:hypothetical protein
VPLTQLLIKPTEPHLHGASLGQDHLAAALAGAQPAGTDLGIIFDFSSTKSITASYLKATVLAALRAGRSPDSQDRVPSPFVPDDTLFAFVTGCGADVAADISEFFSGRKLALLHLDRWDSKHLHEARMMGALDPILFRTLQGVAELKNCTANDLAGRSSETITVNGWSNRLADLYQMRLVARRRESKFWIYSPIVERTLLWA